MFLRVISRPPSSPLSPYTTLFRSRPQWRADSVSDAARAYAIRLCAGLRAIGPVAGHLVRHQCTRRSILAPVGHEAEAGAHAQDRKSTRLNSSHTVTSYAVFCLKKK